MARTRKYEVGVGLLLVAAAGVLAFLAVKVGALDSMGEAVRVEARFEDAAGLQPGSVVSIAGVSVGTVDALALDRGAAKATLRIDPAAGVTRGAKVRIRARSLLGEKYLEVQPGDGAPIADGDTLAVVGRQVEIDELIAMMAPIFEAVDGEEWQSVTARIRERLQKDPALVDRWFEAVDRTLTNAATASESLPGLVSDGRSALGDARSAIGDARSAVKQVDRRARELEPLMTRADRTLGNVEAASEKLPGLVQRVDVMVERADGLVGQFDARSAQIDRILDNLSEIDKWELRRLLREEGIVVRLRARDVEVPETTRANPSVAGDSVGSKSGHGKSSGKKAAGKKAGGSKSAGAAR